MYTNLTNFIRNEKNTHTHTQYTNYEYINTFVKKITRMINLTPIHQQRDHQGMLGLFTNRPATVSGTADCDVRPQGRSVSGHLTLPSRMHRLHPAVTPLSVCPSPSVATREIKRNCYLPTAYFLYSEPIIIIHNNFIK